MYLRISQWDVTVEMMYSNFVFPELLQDEHYAEL